MTAIKSYVWLVLNNKSGEVGSKIRNYLTKVYDSSERMIAMINDMLNVSRIETGRLQLEIVPASIPKVLDQVVGELSAKAAETGVEIKTTKEAVIPLVLVDRDKLAEIFTNLIGNALKFTSKGGAVTVTSQKSGGMVETSVTDTGIGISKENIEKLFKKYGKLNESYATVSPSTGTGLGLYITKQYLEKMHGTVSVKSTLGKGTTFTFSLPIAKGVTKETEEKKEVAAFVPKSIIK
jgi:signal transduction histidine kinase